MKKTPITMIILIIALMGATIFNTLNIDDLSRENILLRQMVATSRTTNENRIESAKKELQDDVRRAQENIGRTQEDLAALEDSIKNKAEKKDFEAEMAMIAKKADRQDLAGLEDKIFDPAKIYKETKKGSVNIITTVGSAAGFLFKGNDQIVTAYHAVNAGPGAIVMVIPNDEVHFFIMGKVKKIKPEWDLALIQLDEPMAAEPLLPREGPAFVGEPIVVIGNPAGLNNSTSTGVISGLDRNFPQFPKIDFIQVDASAYFGSSGGPIMDRNGKVIGFISQTMDTSNPSFSMAVPIDYVRRFLEEK